MTHRSVLAPGDLEKLRALDTCAVSNAIERLSVRLRNEGFVYATAKCQFSELGPMVGYAVTGRIRTATPPMTHRCYYDRMDWWTYVASLPAPRVMVLQDTDHTPGFGAFVGEIHANIGLVRDLPAVEALGFQLFAGSVSVSHSYAHIVDFGHPVEIGGLTIRPGDLIHGDRHGVLTVPLEIAAAVPAEASNILAAERDLRDLCCSPTFTLEELATRIRGGPGNCDLPWRPR